MYLRGRQDTQSTPSVETISKWIPGLSKACLYRKLRYQPDLSLSLTVTGRLRVNSIYQHVFVFKLDIISKSSDSRYDAPAEKNTLRCFSHRRVTFRGALHAEYFYRNIYILAIYFFTHKAVGGKFYKLSPLRFSVTSKRIRHKKNEKVIALLTLNCTECSYQSKRNGSLHIQFQNLSEAWGC